MPLPDFELGEVLRLRKTHACGSADWQVTRLGADIGLRCLTCKRYLLLERATLEKRIKTRVSAGASSTSAGGPLVPPQGNAEASPPTNPSDHG